MPKQCALKLLTTALLLLFCTGCSTYTTRPPVVDEVDKVSPKSIIDDEKQALLPGPPSLPEQVAPVTRGIKPEVRLISMAFQNAPLGDVLRAITLDSRLNLSVESDVDLSRPVTVQTKNILFEEALEMVIGLGAGYAWSITGDTLYIQQFEERVYHLDYLDMPGETEIEVGGDMLATSVEAAGISGKYQIKSKLDKTQTDFWAGLAEAIEGMKSEKGMLRINRNTGVIFMRDTPKRIASMVRFLDSLADSLNRQVFIEAKVFEVVLNDNAQYGIDWTKFDIHFKKDLGFLPESFNLNINNGGTLVLDNKDSFSGVLDYLETQGDVSVVSNPHLSVMNGKSSLLTVGYQLPFGDISGVDVDPNTGRVTYRTSIKRAILGLQLGITTHISSEGIVTLNIVPTLTRLQGEAKVELPTSATTIQSVANPIINLQELSTTVRVREGNAIVLGGLISQMREANHQGLPWVSQFPFFKFLFKHMDDKKENRELVIFITPHIRKPI
jgi:MSHA type pilus biogenesis protein MshL